MAAITTYSCCDDRRRQAAANSKLNGIDYLEVVDRDASTPEQRQRILNVHFLKTPAPPGIVPANVQIAGGERITGVVADAVSYQADILAVYVNTPGDFSTYTLSLVQLDQNGQPTSEPLSGLDPRLSSVDFSFKVECPSDFDCSTSQVCAETLPVQPEISYLAKDFASFRQLMLDRLAVLVPAWRERHTADLGMALVEVIAYVGDYLSYNQDAVATEAYLGTARRRVSVRRHARLVDYFLHDGSNARVWAYFEVAAYQVMLPKGTQLFTRLTGQALLIPPGSAAYGNALLSQPVVFETLQDGTFYQAHNQMRFYTWGGHQCCLATGATHATLLGSYPHLGAGAVVIFEEVLGARTGQPEDADPSRRHAVRLASVTASSDPLGGQFNNPPTGNPVAITEIQWGAGDALPFPFCISTRIAGETGEQDISDVTVARGNIVPADHGLTVAGEDLGAVPSPTLFAVPPANGNPCQDRALEPVPPRYRPRLRQKPLTYARPYDDTLSATETLSASPGSAIAQLNLVATDLEGRVVNWAPQPDLLSSAPDSPNFVVETESDGRAYLRFGDNQNGLCPAAGTRFNATYRTGNGTQGNVAAEALGHVVSVETAITGVRNQLPAQGGVEMEDLENARRNAPFAFRTQERAVTPDDYVQVAERHPQVQQAAATFRWTGSWHTVFLTVERAGGLPVDGAFQAQLQAYLEPYRMAGQDLVIDSPVFVPLELDVLVRVQPDYFRSDVEAALLDVFSNRILPDGTQGVFYPANFGFGQRVYLSPLYAAAQAVAGVASVQITALQRQGNPASNAADAGFLQVERLEIPRLDNDPNYPERGVFRLTLEGGK